MCDSSPGVQHDLKSRLKVELYIQNLDLKYIYMNNKKIQEIIMQFKIIRGQLVIIP